MALHFKLVQTVGSHLVLVLHVQGSVVKLATINIQRLIKLAMLDCEYCEGRVCRVVLYIVSPNFSSTLKH